MREYYLQLGNWNVGREINIIDIGKNDYLIRKTQLTQILEPF